MKLTFLITLFLATAISALNFFPYAHAPGSKGSHTAGNISGGCTTCICIDGRLAFSSHHTPHKRSRRPDVSFPPPSIAAPSAKNNTDISQPAIEHSQPPLGSSTSQTLITALFRAVITILTLFNVNITWRLHGKSRDTLASKTLLSNITQQLIMLEIDFVLREITFMLNGAGDQRNRTAYLTSRHVPYCSLS